MYVYIHASEKYEADGDLITNHNLIMINSAFTALTVQTNPTLIALTVLSRFQNDVSRDEE
jgi:hypothetical protein